MPACATMSDTAGMSMRHSFAHHEHKINPLVRTSRNDFCRDNSHNWNMARRGKPTSINWYLKEWMDMVFPQARGRQAKMSELTG